MTEHFIVKEILFKSAGALFMKRSKLVLTVRTVIN